MAARAISSGTISFGLVSIPVKLYVAASPQSVHFNQLHAKCGSRLRQQLYCPVDEEVVSRNDIVKGYEYAKDQYVRFSDDELKRLEAERSNAIEILEFVPLDTVDLVYVEKSYYLGPDKGGDKAYALLSQAMMDTEKVAVGQQTTRGKEQLVLLRPYKEGLLLHYIYHADEVRAFEDLGVAGGAKPREGELGLAEKLIEQLTSEKFEPTKYTDAYRERVLAAVEQKVAGEEVTVAPEQPTAQIIDLFEALKASLGQKPPPAANKAEDEAPTASSGKGRGKGPSKAVPRAAGKKRRSSSG